MFFTAVISTGTIMIYLKFYDNEIAENFTTTNSPENMKPIESSDNLVDHTYFLVIAIPSLPGSIAQRAAIRRTWLNLTRWISLPDNLTPHVIDKAAHDNHVPDKAAHDLVKVMFILGNTLLSDELREEMDKHQDIYIVNELQEQRTVLKYKVLWALEYSLNHFKYTYFLKTDEDILVNFPPLYEKLASSARRRLYTGSCHQEYGGFAGYPVWQYCSGGGYVLSRDVVEAMMRLPEEVHNVPFRPEDGYVGWLVYNLNKLSQIEVPVQKIPKALKTYGYKCGPFDSLFYHEVQTPNKMDMLFELVNYNNFIPCKT